MTRRPQAGRLYELLRPDATVTLPMDRLHHGLVLVALVLTGLSAACAPPDVSSSPTPSPTAPSAAQTSLEDQFIAVVGKVSPSVVAIQAGSSLGSGVIFDAQGDIVTNAHVVSGSSTYRVFLASGLSYPASLVGSFAADDLAVMRINASDLRAAQFGDSDHLRAGSIVMAIGSPLGLQGSVTEGIVSASDVRFRSQTASDQPSLASALAGLQPGQNVVVVVLRPDGSKASLTARLGELPG